MTTAATRPPLLGQALVGGLLPVALLALAATADVALLAGVILVQILGVLGFLALVDAPASAGVFLVSGAAAVAADAVVWFDDGDVGGLAGVVALALVGSLVHQLARRERSRVTESMADTFAAVVFACATVCLLAAEQQPGGHWAVRGALAATAAAALTGRVADRVAPRPALAHGSTRGWPGLVLALGAGVAACVLVVGDHLSSGEAIAVGLAAAATLAAVDLAVDLAAAELTPSPWDARRVAALRPVSTVLPYALLGPVALTAVLLLDRA